MVTTTTEGLWVRRFHPAKQGPVPRLVLFPHAGGSASYYFPMSQALAPDVEVLALQYPGRQDRRAEPCVDNLSRLADLIFDALRPWLGPPLAFFGHSMGSIVAFEVARRFQSRLGEPPVRLIASGYPAPSRLPEGTVHLRDDPGLIGQLRTIGGTDAKWLEDEDVVTAALPAVRGDYRAIETHVYEPGPPLRCPIVTLVGEEDPHTTVDNATAWGEHTAATFELQIFPGGHFYLDACRDSVVSTIRDTVLGRREVRS